MGAGKEYRGVPQPGWDELGPPDEVISTEWGVHPMWNLSGPEMDDQDLHDVDFGEDEQSPNPYVDPNDDEWPYEGDENYPEEW